jgi:hypothetical protein
MLAAQIHRTMAVMLIPEPFPQTQSLSSPPHNTSLPQATNASTCINPHSRVVQKSPSKAGMVKATQHARQLQERVKATSNLHHRKHSYRSDQRLIEMGMNRLRRKDLQIRNLSEEEAESRFRLGWAEGRLEGLSEGGLKVK